MRVLPTLIGLFVALPISFYINYSLLQAIHADRLLMFLFWINMPVIFFVQIAVKLTEKK